MERYGWTSVHVDCEQPWSYTIGLREHAGCELVVTGLDGIGGYDALDAIAARLHVVVAHLGMDVPRELPALGRRWRLDDVDEAEWATDRFALSWAVHDDIGPPPRAVQVVWSDEDGRFPDDPSCDPLVVAQQPLLRTPRT